MGETSVLMLFLAFWAAPLVDTPEKTPPEIGSQIAEFTLPDIHRRDVSLSSFPDKVGYVIIFTGTECPLANLYVPTLIEFHDTYGPRGIQFLAINSNSQDPFVRVSGHAQERKLPFPMLKDFDQHVATSMGARRTPEVFFLNGAFQILYHGQIDDRYGLTYKRDNARKQPLKDALEEFLAGKPISTPKTEAVGCIIGKSPKPRFADPVTYYKDIAPILQRRCQECHRPDQIGPFSLTSFDEAKSWSESLYEAVREQRMPPWHADPEYGKFTNTRLLPQSERDLLLGWVEQGCPRGNEQDAPKAASFSSEWSIGKPDLVFEMPQTFSVPATGVVDYKRFVVDPKFSEDVWVQAAEAKPGNREIVHHIVVYIKAPGRRLYELDGSASTLVGWAPGDMPALYPDGIAKKIPAGSKLVFEMHYTPNGLPHTDRSSVGIILASEPPSRIAKSNILAKWRIKIPAGASDHVGKASYLFREDSRILALMPHMHLRGLRAEYSLRYPDGSEEILLSVPDYDFNWQSVYRFAEPIKAPKGSRITFTGHWDNSQANPRNPDPAKTITWGEQTWDEMLNGWLDYVPENPIANKTGK